MWGGGNRGINHSSFSIRCHIRTKRLPSSDNHHNPSSGPPSRNFNVPKFWTRDRHNSRFRQVRLSGATIAITLPTMGPLLARCTTFRCKTSITPRNEGRSSRRINGLITHRPCAILQHISFRPPIFGTSEFSYHRDRAGLSVFIVLFGHLPLWCLPFPIHPPHESLFSNL